MVEWRSFPIRGRNSCMKCVVRCEVAVLLVCGVFLFAQCAPPLTAQKAEGEGVIRLRIKPCCPSVPSGGKVQFSVTLGQSKNLEANWSLSGPGCKGSACGTVSAAGVYTAPRRVPNPPTVWVKATLASDTSQETSATVSLCSCEPEPAATNKCWSACVLPNSSHYALCQPG